MTPNDGRERGLKASGMVCPACRRELTPVVCGEIHAEACKAAAADCGSITRLFSDSKQ